MNWNKSFKGSDSIYGETIDTKRWELIGNYQLAVPGRMVFAFSATGHRQDSYYGRVPYFARQTILFGQLTWDKSLAGGHNLLAGLAARNNYYDDNSTATRDTFSLKNKPEQSFLPGIFVQDEWKISPYHTLLSGLRLDHHPSHGFIFTPRLAYKWQLSSHQALRLNAGTGFRVVNLFTEDHAALTGSRQVEVRNKLNPETSYNVNLNYTLRFGPPSRTVLVDASVWYSYFHNQIFADYETDPRKIIYDNLSGYASSKGFTLNLESQVMKRLKAILGITLQNVSKTDLKNGQSFRQTPMLTEKWSGTWTISYTLPLAGLTVDYTGNVYGPMRLPLVSALDPRSPNSPVWSIQNVQVTKWISQRFECFAGVKNLLNWTPAKNNPFLIPRTHDPFDKKLEYGPSGNVLATPENPYALRFDPSYIYAPNQGIRFFAGLRLQIRE
jgi:outer membrane receptor for ferrienterochelin and colicins